jgi:GH15 family glucan-1,4-alpha-glucosidase
LRDYAPIGNKRTAALVALDGSIDWMPIPTLGGPSVFAALLDEDGGGRFALRPSEPFSAGRRYVDGTNVLETTFTTASGSVRVTDAISRPMARGLLWNQVIRRVDGLAGEVPMQWQVLPRFEYGATAVAPERRAGVPAFVHGPDVLAVEAFDAGAPQLAEAEVGGRFAASEGSLAVVALSAFHDEPLTFSSRDHLLECLASTIARWREWLQSCRYEGPWPAAVRRSALALDLLVDDETGAIAAAATMGLPERVGGSRNYDYRYGWLRDTNLTLQAMLRLGLRDQVHTSLGWMLQATRATHPRLRPMYRLDGSPRLPDESLPLAGYRDSRPVLLGNGAQEQLQLGNYGDLLDMTLHYVQAGGSLAPQARIQLAEATDFLCRIWRLPDASIWELGDQQPYTQGKLASWLALDRAVQLAERGELPADRAAGWRREARVIRRYLETRCWSPRARAYVRAAGSDELDASVLLATRGSFFEDERDRLDGTIEAIRRELGAGGPLLYRYSGMQDQEGAFLACSFWLVEALVSVGRRDEALQTMEAMIALANDVGLYSEEIDPASGDFLGNLPQALTHLALVNAAARLAEG